MLGLAGWIASFCSKVLARLHRWYSAAWVLACVPLATLDETSVGRLRYALMMANRTHPERTQRLLHRVAGRNGRTSPELLLELAAMATAVGQRGQAADLLVRAGQAATAENRPETADAASRLLHLNRADTLGTLIPALQAKLGDCDLQTDGLVTLVPVSGRYLDLWQLWLQQVRKHAGQHVVAMVMDNGALAVLQDERDVTIVDVREFFSWNSRGRLHPHTRGTLWYLRVLLLQCLVQAGHRVLVLDLDAMPVGDVQTLCSTLPYADVVAQQDHSIPMDVDRQLGFVLCCGFMLWTPTTASLRLLQLFASETAVECDDQLALNHLLARNGIQKEANGYGILRFTSLGARIVCPGIDRVSRSLRSGDVVRHFHQKGQTAAEIRVALSL